MKKYTYLKNTLLLLVLSTIVLSTIIGIIGCTESKSNDDNFICNINMRIAAMDSQSSLSGDKFHRPQLCNAILFETIEEPKQYMEINTCSGYADHNIHINTEWLYNHKKGDIVHFDHLKKERFFTIREDLRPK